MNNQISSYLREIAEDGNVKILFAVEAGSRVWGYSHADSDYDVKFVYCHTEDWYLDLRQNKKDTIHRSFEDGLYDFQGWDIRKALNLFAKGNPSMHEWCRSPIEYTPNDESFVIELEYYTDSFFNSIASFFHFRDMAYNEWRLKIREEDQFKLKSLINVLRPLLVCEYILTSEGPHPLDVRDLWRDVNVLQTYDDGYDRSKELDEEFLSLVALRELGKKDNAISYSSYPTIYGYIEHMFEKFEDIDHTHSDLSGDKMDIEKLNTLFRKTVRKKHTF